MRIALLGDFDTYLFRGLERPAELGQYRLSPALNLARGFRDLGISDLHYLVTTSEVRRVTVDQGPFGKLYRLPSPPLSGSATFFLWRRRLLLKQLAAIRPDIVHGQGTEREYAFVAATCGYRSVITFHGIMARVQRTVPPGLLSLAHVSRWAEWVVTQKATDVICISSEVEDFLRERRSTAYRYRIPNAVAPCYFDVEPAPRAAGIYALLFVGTIYPLKGVLELVKAFAMLDRNVRLRLAGPIGGAASSYLARIRQFASRLCVSERIDWLGPLNERDVADEMSRADALVLPSFHESFGMCVAEAMAAGLPVVASRIGGITDLIEHDRTGLLVAPGNVDELANTLRRVLSHEPLRNSLGAAARLKAQESYLPSRVAEQTMRVYESILKRHISICAA